MRFVPVAVGMMIGALGARAEPDIRLGRQIVRQGRIRRMAEVPRPGRNPASREAVPTQTHLLSPRGKGCMPNPYFEGEKEVTDQRDSEIRIYVACLAAYNNGHLHGRWIDATQGIFAMQSEIREMLAASPVAGAEEWVIHDFEGYEAAPVDEWLGLDSVASLAAFIAEHGRLGGALVAHFGCIAEAREAIEERYSGCHRSLADFAEELTEQQGDISEHLAPYIDYERMGRDLAISDVFAIETDPDEVHVFWSH